MRRRGTLTVDVVASLAACGLILATVTEAAAQNRGRQREEARSSELDVAQNLLNEARLRLRLGEGTLPERAGWTWSRRMLADGVVELRVRSEQVSLATLITSRDEP